MRSPWLRVEWSVFVLLVGSYAFFWHSRDWNTASRLILTYAMADRGTVCLDGLDRQTGDIALFQGHYYCDKLPGFSLLGMAPYRLARAVVGFPAHPLKSAAKDYWPADYWVTLGTSGLFTAITAVLLVRLARDMGCLPRRAALVGLAYGLATPAYVYATLAYGHQLSAFALTASFYLLYKRGTGREADRLVAAGFLAAYAAVTELQVGPASAILGLYLLVQCLRWRRGPDALACFAIGAAVPSLILLAYNMLAFGSPWEMGYFHHATARFAKVHNRQNPLGLRMPEPTLVVPLLWGEHRGLLFYAPILVLAFPGWLVLAAQALRHGCRVIGDRRGRFRREPQLPRMDGGLVNRASPAGLAAAFRHDSRRGRPGRPGPLVLPCHLAGNGTGNCRRGSDPAFPGGGGQDPSGRGCAVAGHRLATLDRPRSATNVVDRPALHSQRGCLAGTRLGATTAGKPASDPVLALGGRAIAGDRRHLLDHARRLAWSRLRAPRPGC